MARAGVANQTPGWPTVFLGVLLGSLPFAPLSGANESGESPPGVAAPRVHKVDHRAEAIAALRPVFQARLKIDTPRKLADNATDWVSIDELIPAARSRRSVLAGSVPLMLETRFNPPAAAHLAANLPDVASKDAVAPAASATSLAPLPSGALVTLEVWWPMARRGGTPLPVWTHKRRARPGGSNGFLSWDRVFRITNGDNGNDDEALAFAGRFRNPVRNVSLSAFKTQKLTATQARRWMERPSARKLARMVLGRDLAGGDHLALVAMHLLAGNGAGGIWGTVWWGDEHSGGVALGPPDTGVSYRLDATSDAVLPREADGSPNRTFNPWLEGGLPHSGDGAGVDSNCISCHSRAASPPDDFLRVTRGLQSPRAGARRTAMLWSVAIAQQRKSD
ncbi:MAG: hypothetical protein AAGI72_12925 [Pseudomonadota bacterium]